MAFAQIDDDAAQPGAKAVRFAEATQREIGMQDGFLGQLQAPLAVTDDANRQGERDGLVPQYQLVKCLPLTCLSAAHKFVGPSSVPPTVVRFGPGRKCLPPVV